MIDPHNTGEWESCVDLTNVDLPENWAVDSYIGITASTGQLSGAMMFVYFLLYFSIFYWISFI